MQFFIVYFYPLPTVSKVDKYSWKKYILWVLSSVCVWENFTFNFRVSVLKTVCCFFLALRAVSQFHHGRALTPKCTFLLLQASIIVRPDQFRSNFIHLQVKKCASNIGLPQKDKTKLSSGNIKRGNLMTVSTKVLIIVSSSYTLGDEGETEKTSSCQSFPAVFIDRPHIRLCFIIRKRSILLFQYQYEHYTFSVSV